MNQDEEGVCARFVYLFVLFAVRAWTHVFLFFFQAEDGIRDGRMTGVQTCALPIYLAGGHVRVARPCGVNAHLKVPCLVAGMIAGADSIEDMDLLRHGAVPALFGGVRAPSTLGSFLRSFTWGNVLQLQKVHRLVLAELAR